MVMNIRRFFLLTGVLLFCVLGCTRDRGHLLMPDHGSAPTDDAAAKASFEQNVMPILAVKCALSGCHGENPQEGYDYRTYESFIAGGEHGPVFIPGDAEGSEIVKVVVEGKMPPPESGLPTLSTAELQILKDWIDQQEPQGDVGTHDHDHSDDAESDGHGEADDAHSEADDAHSEADDAHSDMNDEHPDDGENGHGADDNEN